MPCHAAPVMRSSAATPATPARVARWRRERRESFITVVSPFLIARGAPPQLALTRRRRFAALPFGASLGTQALRTARLTIRRYAACRSRYRTSTSVKGLGLPVSDVLFWIRASGLRRERVRRGGGAPRHKNKVGRSLSRAGVTRGRLTLCPVRFRPRRVRRALP